jgi:hypothetical protein
MPADKQEARLKYASDKAEDLRGGRVPSERDGRDVGIEASAPQLDLDRNLNRNPRTGAELLVDWRMILI